MDNILSMQLKELFHFCLAGVEISILFDIFRAKRKAIKTSDVITNIEDIIYWIIVGFIIVYTTTKYTSSNVRSYMVIGIAIGVVGYYFLVSKFIVKLLTSVFSIILFPVKKINKLIKKY